jgi:hypothetical protein
LPEFRKGEDLGIIENALQLTRRITMTAKFKKMSKKWSLAGVLVIAVIACVALAICASSLKGNPDPAAEQEVVTGLGYGAWATDCDAASVEEAGEAENEGCDGSEPQALGWGAYRVAEPKESD